MRAVTVGLAAAVLMAVGGGSAEGQPAKVDAKLLVGKWSPPAPNKTGTVVEFTADGKMRVTAGGMNNVPVNATYKVDGDKLTLRFDDEEPTKVATVTITSLTRDELVTDEEGKKKRLVRVTDKK